MFVPQLEHELILTTGKSDIKDIYLRNWKLWIPAINKYSKLLKNKEIAALRSSVSPELGMSY